MQVGPLLPLLAQDSLEQPVEHGDLWAEVVVLEQQTLLGRPVVQGVP